MWRATGETLCYTDGRINGTGQHSLHIPLLRPSDLLQPPNERKFAENKHVMVKKGLGREGPYIISAVYENMDRKWAYDLDPVDVTKGSAKKGLLVAKLLQPNSKGRSSTYCGSGSQLLTCTTTRFFTYGLHMRNQRDPLSCIDCHQIEIRQRYRIYFHHEL